MDLVVAEQSFPFRGREMDYLLAKNIRVTSENMKKSQENQFSKKCGFYLILFRTSSKTAFDSFMQKTVELNESRLFQLQSSNKFHYRVACNLQPSVYQTFS